MFTSMIFFLVPFLSVAFLPLVLKMFTAEDLNEMGVYLEDQEPSLSIDPTQGSEPALLTAAVACGCA